MSLELELVRAWRRYVEHLGGKHNQKSHGYRFGSTAAMKSTLKRLKSGDYYDRAYAVDDYKQRVRARSADVTKDQSVKPKYGKERVKIPAGQNGAVQRDIVDRKATYEGRKRRTISANIVDRTGKDETVMFDFNETFKGTNSYQIEINGKRYAGISNKDAGLIGKELVRQTAKKGKLSDKDVKSIIDGVANRDYTGKKNSHELSIDVITGGKANKVSVPALSYNGLSVHRSLSDPSKVTITHDKSGFRIGDANSVNGAIKAAQKLIKAGNWDIPASEIQKSKNMYQVLRELRDSGEIEQ